MLEGLLLAWTGTAKFISPIAPFKSLFGLKVEVAGQRPVGWRRSGFMSWTTSSIKSSQGQVLNYELKLPDLSERWLQGQCGAILQFHR